MVSPRQEREIRERMVDIKQAKREGKPEHVVKKRTQELYAYLQKEGIITPPDE